MKKDIKQENNKTEHKKNEKIEIKKLENDKSKRKTKKEKKQDRNTIIFRTIALLMCISLVFATIASCIYYIINY